VEWPSLHSSHNWEYSTSNEKTLVMIPHTRTLSSTIKHTSDNVASSSLSAYPKKPPIIYKASLYQERFREDGAAQQNPSLHSNSAESSSIYELLHAKNNQMQSVPPLLQWTSHTASGTTEIFQSGEESTPSRDKTKFRNPSNSKSQVDSQTGKRKKSRFFQLGNIWIPMNGKPTSRQSLHHPRTICENSNSSKRQGDHRPISAPAGENTSNSHLCRDQFTSMNPSISTKFHQFEMPREMWGKEFSGKVRPPRHSHEFSTSMGKFEMNVLFQRILASSEFSAQQMD
jgi:hypothetical protein